MTPQPKKTKEQIAIRLHPDVIAALDTLAAKMHFTRTGLFQMALNDFFEKHGVSVGVNTDERIK